VRRRDRLERAVRAGGARWEEIKFTGQGCAICMASASMMTMKLKGRTRAEATELLNGFHNPRDGRGRTAVARARRNLQVMEGVRKFSPAREVARWLAWARPLSRRFRLRARRARRSRRRVRASPAVGSAIRVSPKCYVGCRRTVTIGRLSGGLCVVRLLHSPTTASSSSRMRRTSPRLVGDNLSGAGFHVFHRRGWCGTRSPSPAAKLPTLIVLDLMLPGMSGLEVTRRLQRGCRDGRPFPSCCSVRRAGEVESHPRLRTRGLMTSCPSRSARRELVLAG